MKPIEYKSRDGLTIHGYLTLPVGREAKNLPVVVNPHGGPWARDAWGYNPEVQFLANRGYAVFQMNFRGSTGYGRKFWETSFKQWGKTMQDDITDGVQWLIKQGIADPKRVAIYGGSYGGYATLAGVTFTPDLYAAAVDYVGVANLFTFMNTIPPYWKPFLDMFHEMVGDPEKDKELFTAASPVMHADKIKTPLFVAQGAQDPRVNKNESDQMVEALKKRGVDVRIHGERQRRPRLPQRGKQVRLLRGDGKIPRPAFASGNGASFWSRRRFSLGENKVRLRLDRRKSIFRFAGIDPSRQLAVANAVEEINHEAKPKPDEEPNPRFNRQTQHERKHKAGRQE